VTRSTSTSADAIFLDLEDAVLATEKEDARRQVVRALNEMDWGATTVLVRINDLSSSWAADDIAAIVACERLDGVLIPKVATPEDVRRAERLIIATEARRMSRTPVRIELLIESPLAVINIEAMLVASDRVSGAVFGAGDYSLAMGTYDVLTGLKGDRAGKTTPAGASDPWLYARSKLTNACRALERSSVDGVFIDIADPDGFREFAERARRGGFDGVLAIHPSQVSIANEVFAPRDDELAWARSVLEAMSAPENAGRGAIRLNNRLVDVAHVKLAEKLLARAEALTRSKERGAHR
jgi:malyl-CoA/(S)-citramalyl-CoA lyase